MFGAQDWVVRGAAKKLWIRYAPGLAITVTIVSQFGSCIERLVPGTKAGCWGGPYSYTRCCVEDNAECWFETDDSNHTTFSGFNRDLCCSGFLEAAQRNLFPRPPHRATDVRPNARPELIRCLRSGSIPNTSLAELMLKPRSKLRSAFAQLESQLRWSFSKTDGLCSNPFVRTVACVAQLVEVDIVLDLFLGGGCTTAAFAYGLGPARYLRAEQAANEGNLARSPEVFSFESNYTTLRHSLGFHSRLGAGRRLEWWRTQSYRVDSRKDIMRLQEKFAESNVAEEGRISESLMKSQVTVYAFYGEPYPFRVDHTLPPSQGYRWNAIDVMCQNKAPIDAVLIDLAAESVSLERIWLIIEAVCQPQWALLINLNIHSEASWIYHRLSTLPQWHLEVRGHFSLSREQWFAFAELRRVRSWAVFSQREM